MIAVPSSTALLIFKVRDRQPFETLVPRNVGPTGPRPEAAVAQPYSAEP